MKAKHQIQVDCVGVVKIGVGISDAIVKLIPQSLYISDIVKHAPAVRFEADSIFCPSTREQYAIGYGHR